MHIAIVEDEEEVVRELSEMILRYGKEHGYTFEISAFADGIDFLNGYRAVYDVVCMDIEMPHSNGMKVAHKLRRLDRSVSLMFITNLAQYAIEGYSVSAVGYVVKPLRYEAFSFHFERVIAAALHNRKKDVSVVADKIHVRLNADDIFYLEVVNHAVIYHTAQGEYKTWDSLSNVEKLLPPGVFARCNNCFLVNLHHVREVKGDEVTVGNTKLKISRLKKKDFLEALTVVL